MCPHSICIIVSRCGGTACLGQVQLPKKLASFFSGEEKAKAHRLRNPDRLLGDAVYKLKIDENRRMKPSSQDKKLLDILKSLRRLKMEYEAKQECAKASLDCDPRRLKTSLEVFEYGLD